METSDTLKEKGYGNASNNMTKYIFLDVRRSYTHRLKGTGIFHSPLGVLH